VLESLSNWVRIILAISLMADQGPRPPVAASETPASSLLILSCFAQTAVSPPLSAATFHPESYDRPAHLSVTKGAQNEFENDREPIAHWASIQAAWSTRVLGFPGPSRISPRDREPAVRVRYLDPLRVQELILPTKNRREAAKVLRKNLGWATTTKNLSAYVKRHRLPTQWPQRPINSKQVEQVIQTARNARSAIKVLKTNLNWSPTPRGLKRFLKRHGLKYPWPQRPIDLRRIEELIQTASNRDEAVEILRKEWGWYTTPQNLTLFIWRHGLKTPWSRKDAGAMRVSNSSSRLELSRL
jgi:hypothetical protein